MTDLISISEEKLEKMLSRACHRGAKKALEAVGLHDEAAGDDIRELRSVLSGFRDAKKTVWRAFLGWLTRWAITLFLIGICFKMGLIPWDKS
ncbi:MAG: hypothetical protein COB49_00435 [Alphaproteobacteria bacterium]|nr:MAG: hypothetical protein COB49_00435 [Alphaproteobacteria bacterium]